MTVKLPALTDSFDNAQGHDVVERCDHPMVGAFADLWRERCGASSIPDRADLGFEDLAPWFGHVIIMDVLDGGADFRYRLIGTGITGFLGRDYTGRKVKESNFSGAREEILDTFRRPVVEGGPVFRQGFVVWARDRTWRTYSSVHCPLTAGGSAIEKTIGVLYFGADPVSGPDGSRHVDLGRGRAV